MLFKMTRFISSRALVAQSEDIVGFGTFVDEPGSGTILLRLLTVSNVTV